MESEEQENPDKKAAPDPVVARLRPKHGSNWADILDVVAKLIGAGAVVAATIIANRYQSSMTATNLLVQREQADSSLRAGMFHDLIGPIVGPGNNQGVISVDRERLLTELLALNFHEHFELKPLMLHVDNRLAFEDSKETNQAQRDHARDSLRSVARRVIQRQISTLTKADRGSLPAQQACIYNLQMDVRDPMKDKEPTPPLEPCSSLKRNFDDLISMGSPSGIYTLAFTINNTPESWERQSFDVSMRVSRREGDRGGKQIADAEFLLTRFDFPFSSNTLLADGTRFSLVIDRVEPYLKRVHLMLIWFPQDYFAAQERPTNYRQFREKLGLKVKE